MPRKLSARSIGTFLIVMGALYVLAFWPFGRMAKLEDACEYQKVFRADGTLEKELCLKGGEFVRVAREYSPSGRLQKEWDDRGGFRQYSILGKPSYELIRGGDSLYRYTIKTYYEDGELDSVRHYYGSWLLGEDGKPYDGVYQYHYPDGTVRMEETYRNGEQAGPWREYYENGNLKSDFIAEAGNKYARGETYYPDGTVETMIVERPDGTAMVKYDLLGEEIEEYPME